MNINRITECQKCGAKRFSKNDIMARMPAITKTESGTIIENMPTFYTQSNHGYGIEIRCNICGMIHYSDLLDWDEFFSDVLGEDLEEDQTACDHWLSIAEYDETFSKKMANIHKSIA